MKNKKLKIKINSLFGNKADKDRLFVAELYGIPLQLMFGEELYKKAHEEIKETLKEKPDIDVNAFCWGFCLGSVFICDNEEFVKAFKDRKEKKEGKKEGKSGDSVE